MSTGLFNSSDKNVYEKQALIVSKRQQYSDLDLSFLRNSNKDIVPVTDIDAVKASVRHILLTNHGDRPFQPYLGANLRALLFEPADQFTIFAIHEDIRFAITKFEPRIDQIKIRVNSDDSRGEYNVLVAFRVIAQNQNADMNIRLERVR